MHKTTGYALLALVFGRLAIAELAPNYQPQYVQPQQPQAPVYQAPGFQTQPGGPNMAVPVPEQMRPQAPVQALDMQGKPRYSTGERVEYNTEQKQAALDKCEPLKEVDFKAFKKCYATEMKKIQDGLKRRYQEVESRMGQPFRNVSPGTGNFDEVPRKPAFDLEMEK